MLIHRANSWVADGCIRPGDDEACGEVYETRTVGKTGHVVTCRAQLFGNGGVGDDYARNRWRVVCAYENVCRSTGTPAIINWDTEKTNTSRVVGVLSSIE